MIALFTKILEVDLPAFAYRLLHEDFSPVDGLLYSYSIKRRKQLIPYYQNWIQKDITAYDQNPPVSFIDPCMSPWSAVPDVSPIFVGFLKHTYWELQSELRILIIILI